MSAWSATAVRTTRQTWHVSGDRLAIHIAEGRVAGTIRNPRIGLSSNREEMWESWLWE